MCSNRVVFRINYVVPCNDVQTPLDFMANKIYYWALSTAVEYEACFSLTDCEKEMRTCCVFKRS